MSCRRPHRASCLPSSGKSGLEPAAAFLEPHNPPLSERAVDTLFAAARSLADLPERGRPAIRPGYRELVVSFGANAYVIRYRIDQANNRVVITRLWHGREQRS